MNNQEIAKKVIDALGGRENVNSVAHCATRLRVMVKDEGKINKEVIENLEKVQGAFFNSGQYQIIFGTGTVNKMYDEVVALGLPTSSKDDMKAEAAKQGNWFQRAIRTFGDVFVPIIPVIVATGLFMGVRGLFNALEMPLPGDFATYTQILTDTAFIILPGLVVWSTFRVFGGNPAVGIVLGMMLVSGSLPNAWVVASGGEVTAMNFFGFIPVVGLQGSVLPAFIIGVVGAKFEKAVRKVVPDVIDLLVTPFVTLLVMSILGLFVIGPNEPTARPARLSNFEKNSMVLSIVSIGVVVGNCVFSTTLKFSSPTAQTNFVPPASKLPYNFVMINLLFLFSLL